MAQHLEIGPGRGDFLFWLAEQYPDSEISAVEYKPKRFDKLKQRLEINQLKNVRLYLGDARVVLPEKFPNESCDKIFILFSDPWPKRKHAKHRLFQESFVEELLRILKIDGEIFVAHDNPDYVKQIQKVFQKFVSSFVHQDSGVDFPTFYAEKWKKEGRVIQSFSYRKINCKNGRDDLALSCEFTE